LGNKLGISGLIDRMNMTL